MALKSLVIIVHRKILPFKNRVRTQRFLLCNISCLHMQHHNTKLCLFCFFHQGKYYLLLENISQFYRILTPIPLWYTYFTNYNFGGEYFAIFSTAFYFLLKVCQNVAFQDFFNKFDAFIKMIQFVKNCNYYTFFFMNLQARIIRTKVKDLYAALKTFQHDVVSINRSSCSTLGEASSQGRMQASGGGKGSSSRTNVEERCCQQEHFWSLYFWGNLPSDPGGFIKQLGL